jgi:hypothetical protein
MMRNQLLGVNHSILPDLIAAVQQPGQVEAHKDVQQLIHPAPPACPPASFPPDIDFC